MGGVGGQPLGHAQGVGRAPAARTTNPEAGGLRSGLGARRWVKDMNQLSTPPLGAPGFHRKLAKAELHNFARSAPLKGQNAELTEERLSLFLVPQPNA